MRNKKRDSIKNFVRYNLKFSEDLGNTELQMLNDVKDLANPLYERVVKLERYLAKYKQYPKGKGTYYLLVLLREHFNDELVQKTLKKYGITETPSKIKNKKILDENYITEIVIQNKTLSQTFISASVTANVDKNGKFTYYKNILLNYLNTQKFSSEFDEILKFTLFNDMIPLPSISNPHETLLFTKLMNLSSESRTKIESWVERSSIVKRKKEITIDYIKTYKVIPRKFTETISEIENYSDWISYFWDAYRKEIYKEHPELKEMPKLRHKNKEKTQNELIRKIYHFVDENNRFPIEGEELFYKFYKLSSDNKSFMSKIKKDFPEALRNTKMAKGTYKKSQLEQILNFLEENKRYPKNNIKDKYETKIRQYCTDMKRTNAEAFLIVQQKMSELKIFI